MYAAPNHDEGAREDFVREMMIHVSRDLMPGKRTLYENVVKPRFVREMGRSPGNRHEIRRAMEQEWFNQVWGSLRRLTQEMMYDTIGPSIERQLPALISRAAALTGTNGRNRRGSLTLDPALPIPRYHSEVHIHCKPGGYHSEVCADDVMAGAEYDRTYNLFAMGASGPLNDDMGRSVGRFAQQKFPGLKPRRILELGCTVGHSTLP
jgi:hypothetical protein